MAGVLTLVLIAVVSMTVPRGLVVVLILLASGFGLAWSGLLRKKSLEAKYQSVGGASATSSAPTSTTPGSYQNPAGDGYAIATQQKDVTYCVIDGRLVDQ